MLILVSLGLENIDLYAYFCIYLQVENLLIIGHSCCGGIKALMSLQDEVISRFC